MKLISYELFTGIAGPSRIHRDAGGTLLFPGFLLPMNDFQIDNDLILKRLNERDAPELFGVVDSNRAYLRQWLPWLDSNSSVNETLQFIKAVKQQEDNGFGFQTAIWFKGRIAGVIGFHPIDWLNKVVEIGYWLGEQHQGKGIVTRSCRALVDYAFDEYKLHRVQIRCATGNRKSCAIIERLGFMFEGIAHGAEFLYDHFADLYVYGMTAAEWNRLRSQATSQVNPDDVRTIDAVVRALYESVSFEAGAQPDYARLRTLFVKDARVSPPREDGDLPQAVSVADFIVRSEKYLGTTNYERTGFCEKEIRRTTQRFGNIAHLLSVYESRRASGDTQPLTRGMNSIQLLFDQSRWWILSISWDVERPDLPIPPTFLEHQ
ncbi:MAG: GNAT family protein [Bacteroidota bacterium]